MTIDPELWRVIASNGVFAVLFVAYLVWNTKENKRREEAYQSFMLTIAPILQSVNDEIRNHTAVILRVEERVLGCDTRRAKA